MATTKKTAKKKTAKKAPTYRHAKRVLEAFENDLWLPTKEVTAPSAAWLKAQGFNTQYVWGCDTGGRINRLYVSDLKYDAQYYPLWSPIWEAPPVSAGVKTALASMNKVVNQATKSVGVNVYGYKAHVTNTGDIKVGCQTIKADTVAKLAKASEAAPAELKKAQDALVKKLEKAQAAIG